MKILILSDLHHGKDLDFFVEYQLNYLNTTINIIRENNVKKIFLLGDVHDKRRKADIRIINLFKEKYEEIEKLVEEIVVISGNHDCYFKNINNINSIKVFFPNSEKVKFVINECLKIDNHIFIPWINKNNQEKISEFVSKYNSCDNYLYGHFELSGFKMNGDFECTRSQLFKVDYNNYKKVFIGHFHDMQTKDNIMYIGAPYQLISSETPEKGCHILDTEKNVITTIYNKNDIFRNIKIENGLSKPQIKNAVGDIENKIVNLYIDSNDPKYITKVEEVIELKNPYKYTPKFKPSCSIIKDDININNLNDDFMIDSFLDNLEFDNKMQEKLFKQFFKQCYKNMKGG
jgi:DNA repair exonuclease SbcCD nuclease subunit